MGKVKIKSVHSINVTMRANIINIDLIEVFFNKFNKCEVV